jgi:hypothetical protein
VTLPSPPVAVTATFIDTAYEPAGTSTCVTTVGEVAEVAVISVGNAGCKASYALTGPGGP